MANLPASVSKQINPADYKSSPDWFVGRFLSQLNLFMYAVYTALVNGLTFQSNFNSQEQTISVLGASTYSTTFPCSINGIPIGMLLIAKNVSGDLQTPVTGIDFSWYFSAGTIYITSISGLTAGVTYSMTFLIF